MWHLIPKGSTIVNYSSRMETNRKLPTLWLQSSNLWLQSFYMIVSRLFVKIVFCKLLIFPKSETFKKRITLKSSQRLIQTRCICRVQLRQKCAAVCKNRKFPISAETQPSAAAACIKRRLCESAFRKTGHYITLIVFCHRFEFDHYEEIIQIIPRVCHP